MYVLAKLLAAVVSPLGCALVLGGFSLLAGAGGCSRLARWVGVCALAWLLAWSMPATNNWVVGQVEGPWRPVAIEDLPELDVAVVLGGGVAPGKDSVCCPDLEDGADRVWLGSRLQLSGKAKLLLLSGGAGGNGRSEAQGMRVFAYALGVAPEHILLEETSRNTAENARFSAELLRERGVGRVLLVTSAMHMARAKVFFEREGIKVIPVATDYRQTSVRGLLAWIPTTRALNDSADAIKELVAVYLGRWQ